MMSSPSYRVMNSDPDTSPVPYSLQSVNRSTASLDSLDSLLESTQSWDAGTVVSPLERFRNSLRQADRILRERFEQGEDVVRLVTERTRFIDQLLTRAWEHFLEVETTSSGSCALVAVGGYGRGELHPGSDIDIMLLLPDNGQATCEDRIKQFLVFLWDIGLEVGHSVRTIQECVEQASQDITVVTNLIESRLITGSMDLFHKMLQAVNSDRIWPGRDFFEAKRKEQITRYHKFGDTAYNLEPNVKEGPGGLRDIHMIGWVAKRHFGAETLHDLVSHEFLTESEYESLMHCQALLWQVRMALHYLTGRREDRLLFDYQRTLAEQFGYRDDAHQLAVEQFMKRYYLTINELDRMNEMLLQLFQEAILYADEPGDPIPINRRFQARKGFIEVTGRDVFRQYPYALLEIFLILSQHPELKGVRAETIRHIRDDLYLINEHFRNDLRCRSLFLEFLRQPHGITHELRRMHRYNILGSYLPVFGKVIGQMQYDLFHVYTVDEHTLIVVRNLRRFSVPEFEHEFPLCSAIHKRLPKPEILYLAGLFHDIAKGRGGDHSELGASDAESFCLHHGMSDYDARFIAWLVRHHLIMSMTAQRQDISDPEVVNRFAKATIDQTHLNYLYLLTVADIRGTNPSLWNSWRATLLGELYNSAKQALRRGIENPIGQAEVVYEAQRQARLVMQHQGMSDSAIDQLWSNLNNDYFLRYSVNDICMHAHAILAAETEELPLIVIQEQIEYGGTNIFIHAQASNDLFARVTSILVQLGLSIADARVIHSRNGRTFDTYIVQETTGDSIHNPHRVNEIEKALRVGIGRAEYTSAGISRRPPHKHRHFPIETKVFFSHDEKNCRTIMEVITRDHPGLLATVSDILQSLDIQIQNAKIATIGARAEDIFFITDSDGRPLGEPAQVQLRERLLESLAD